MPLTIEYRSVTSQNLKFLKLWDSKRLEPGENY